jgi:hypothetical protein
MIRFKGRLYFRQYMPNKPIKWGIKVWAMCESTSGYCLDWYPYCGKDNNATGLGLGHDVVMNLTRNMRGLGHHLFIDNFYSSPQLSLSLIDHNIGVCLWDCQTQSYWISKELPHHSTCTWSGSTLQEV